MGALTEGIKSIHKKGLFARHQDALYWEYVGYFNGILDSWMDKDPDNRACIDNGKLETLIPNKIAKLVCNYDYHHKERGQFRKLYAQLTIFEATRLLEKKNFQNATVDEFDCTVKELADSMAVALVVHDIREKPAERELYRLVIAEGLSIDKVAKLKKKTTQKVSEIVDKMNVKVKELTQKLLK